MTNTERPHIARSSSLERTGLSTNEQAGQTLKIPILEKKRPAPLSVPKKSADEPDHRPIFTIGSPDRSPNKGCSRFQGVDERYGMFLKACYWCKTAFGETDTIYMYSYLQAFCSETCRGKQISEDEKNNNLPDIPTLSERFLHSTQVTNKKFAKKKSQLQ